MYARLEFWLWPLITHKWRSFCMDTPYIFWKYMKKSFLGHHRSDNIWPNCTRCHFRCTHRHGRSNGFARAVVVHQTSLKQGREIALFRWDEEVIVTGRTARRQGRRSRQRQRSGQSHDPRCCATKPYQKSSELPTSTAHNSKFHCKVWLKVVSIDADMQDDCKELKAGCLAIARFKVWLTKVMARIGGHTRS